MFPESAVAQVHAWILAELADEARRHGVAMLHRRWAELDRIDPMAQFGSPIHSAAPSGPVRSVVVQAHQITWVGDGTGRWGEIGYRAATYQHAVDRLAACENPADLGGFLAWLGEAELAGYPGPFGPLFTTGGDGRHRTHVVKALGLTRLPVAQVRFADVPKLAGDRGRVWFHTGLVPVPAPPQSGPVDPDGLFERAAEAQRATERDQQRRQNVCDAGVAHLEALEQRGFITDLSVTRSADQVVGEFTVRDDLPAYWALEVPEVVERLSRRYARSYPDFLATRAGSAMCDQVAWRRLLGLPESTSQPAPVVAGGRAVGPLAPVSGGRWSLIGRLRGRR